MTSREPLVIRAAVVAAVTGLVHALVVLGLLPIVTEQEAAIAGAIDLLGTVVLVLWTRGAVTPVADPRTATGEPLVPADEPRHRA